MVAVNQDTGKIEWADQLPSSPYGAAAVTNNVVFTTTYSGDLYAFNAATGAILLKTRLPARTNAPVTIDGDYVITAAGQRAPAADVHRRLPARSHGQAPRLRGLVADRRRQKMGEPAIAVRGLRKSFGAKEAVAGIDLEIAAAPSPGSSGRTGRGRPRRSR